MTSRRGLFKTVARLIAGSAAAPIVAKFLPKATTTLVAAGPECPTTICISPEITKQSMEIFRRHGDMARMARMVTDGWGDGPPITIGSIINIRKPARSSQS